MKLNRRAFLGTGLSVPFVFTWGRTTAAEDAADFSGKTIEWWVPFAEGGGSDVWARFFAPYLSKYLPGAPNVLIRNVPGAGSISGSNEFMARARPDGLALLATSGSTQFPFLLGDTRVHYDYTKLVPVLVSPTGGVCYLQSGLGVTKLADLANYKNELVYASQGATSLDLVPLLAFRLLGLNVRPVFGMSGRGDARLAFERGEATIDFQTSSGYLVNVAPLIKEGNGVPLFSWGVLDGDGAIQRDPTFPDLPHFVEAYEAVHGHKPSGLMFNAYKAFFGSGFAAQKIALLPVGTPEPILAAYRKAFADAVADPQLQKAKGDILGEYAQAVEGDIPALYTTATAIDPETRSWVRDFLTKEYQVPL